jgi:energy-converting hydrogenase B subunit D
VTVFEWIFDVLLAVTMVGLAWAALSVRDLFKSVVLFIAFGLLMALAWVRLKAPDVALAEAAIGAGLIGVLLLDALQHLKRSSRTGLAEGKHGAPHRDNRTA